MDNPLFTLATDDLKKLTDEECKQALTALEQGLVVYFPAYSFAAGKQTEALLSETILDSRHKNVSYDHQKQKLGAINKHHTHPNLSALLKSFMHDFAEYSHQLVNGLFPEYQAALRWGRTSYRPAEIKGRALSKRKDDTRLHVDAFPATPVNGLRILRIFCNINPYGEPRVWDLGEPFPQVLNHFTDALPAYNPTIAKLLQLIKATKTLRSAYDHYQLHLHDQMKLDDHYQQTVAKTRFEFPSQSTWIVFTDQVSHAALAGQYLLEQTFYLPVCAMQNPKLSPLSYWEKEKGLNSHKEVV